MAKKTKQEKKGRAAEIVPVRPILPSLAERIDDLFGDRWGPLWPIRWPEFRWPEELAGLKVPAVDVYEEGDQVVVKADLPGLAKADVEVQVAGDVVTISGKKEKEEKIDRKDYHRYERSSGSFSRSVRLPAEVQVDKLTAKLEGGVLQIRAPKTEAAKAKTRKIEVG
jgi:HSP20 family protein